MNNKILSKYTLLFRELEIYDETVSNMYYFTSQIICKEQEGIRIRTIGSEAMRRIKVYLYDELTEELKLFIENLIEHSQADIEMFEQYPIDNCLTIGLKVKSLEDIHIVTNFLTNLHNDLISQQLPTIQFDLQKDNYLYLITYDIFDEDVGKLVYRTVKEIARDFKNLFKVNKEKEVISKYKFYVNGE